MDTIFDYIKWRGDLSFPEKDFCEADGMLFAMASYINYAKRTGGAEMTLSECAKGYCAGGKYESESIGLIFPTKQINRSFCEMAASRRFGRAKVTDFVDKTSVEDGYQFSAVTFHVSKKMMVVSFRGTDDSIVGWREDCCMAFMDEIPSQRMAVEYIESLAAKYPEKKMILTGHSKGGNLAMYSTVKCSRDAFDRIVRAYSFDGPGLTRSTVESDEFKAAEKKLTVILPQSSMVGIMFAKGEKYHVVESRAKGVLQHDPYTWVLEGPQFVKLSELSSRGKKNEDTFRRRMDNMSGAEKKSLVESLFGIVEATGARTLTDFSKAGPKNVITLAKTYGGLDKEQRELIQLLLFKLLEIKSAVAQENG